MTSINCIKNRVLVLFICLSSTIFSQKHNLGFTAGYNLTRFVNFNIDNDYTQQYNFKSGFGLSAFHDFRGKPFVSFRTGLQYVNQNADLEVKSQYGHSSFYKDLAFNFQKLDINFNLVFHVVDKEKVRFNLFVGPNFSYMLQSRVKGKEWTHYTAGSDSKIHIERDDRNSKDIPKFYLGVNLGFDVAFPVSKQLDILVQNSYNMSISNALGFSGLNKTSLFSGALRIGILYHLNK